MFLFSLPPLKRETAWILGVTIVGLVLNIVAYAIFFTNRSVRTSKNRYVIYLIAANILCAQALAPAAIFISAHGDGVPVWIKDAESVIETSAVTVFVYTSVAVSYERYHSIFHSVHHAMDNTPLRSLSYVCILWLISFALSCPSYYRRTMTNNDHMHKIYMEVLFIFVFVFPLCIMFALYMTIAQIGYRSASYPFKLNNKQNISANFSPFKKHPLRRAGELNNLYKQDKGTMIFIVLMIGSFIFYWGPFFFYYFMIIIYEGTPEPCRLSVVLPILFHTVLSPIVHVYSKKKFRTAVKRFFIDGPADDTDNKDDDDDDDDFTFDVKDIAEIYQYNSVRRNGRQVYKLRNSAEIPDCKRCERIIKLRTKLR